MNLAMGRMYLGKSKAGVFSSVIACQAVVLLILAVPFLDSHGGIIFLYASLLELIPCVVGVVVGFRNKDQNKKLGRISGVLNSIVIAVMVGVLVWIA